MSYPEAAYSNCQKLQYNPVEVPVVGLQKLQLLFFIESHKGILHSKNESKRNQKHTLHFELSCLYMMIYLLI